MKDDEKRNPRRRSVWLPATVLLLLLSLVGGAIYWLTLIPPPDEPALAGSSGGPPSGEPPKPEATKPDTVKPGKQQPEKPATPAETETAAEKPAETRPTDTPQTGADAAEPTARAEKAAAPDETGEPANRTPPPATTAATTSTGPAAPATPKPATSSPTAPPEAAIGETKLAPPVRPVFPKLPRPPASVPLPRAPDPALVEQSPRGPLPIVGRDGREAWRVYARPFDQLDNRPRISVVLYGLGTSGSATRAAIQGLPGSITLAFSPYADGLNNWIAAARAAGHEVLLMVPMEPRNYPDYDPGPRALLTSLTLTENTNRLEWILARAVGYVGITDFMGSRFTNSTQHMRALFRNLRKRGLMFLESRVSARAVSGEIAAASKVPFASSALYIDSQASRAAIDAQLAETERLAKKLGAVVVMGFLYPVTLERVANWASTVEKRGFSLAPVSATAKRRN